MAKFLANLKKGALHKQLGMKPGAKIPVKKLEAAKKKGGLEEKRAVFALNARKWKHK